LRGYFGGRSEQRNFLFQKQVGVDLLGRVEFLFVRIREHRSETKRAVVIPLHFERFLVAPQFALPALAGKDHMDVAAGQDSAALFGVPSVLEPAAPKPIGPSGLLGFAIEDFYILLEPRIGLNDEIAVESALRRPFDRSFGRER